MRYKFEFVKNDVKVWSVGNIMRTGRRLDNVNIMPLTKIEIARFAQVSQSYLNGLDLWHYRLRHVNKKAIDSTTSKTTIKEINLNEQKITDACKSCMYGKMSNVPMPLQTNLVIILGVSINTEVGHVNITYIGGARYFVTFVDEETGDAI